MKHEENKERVWTVLWDELDRAIDIMDENSEDSVEFKEASKKYDKTMQLIQNFMEVCSKEELEMIKQVGEDTRNEARNEAQIKLEKEKSKIPWKKVGLEMAKVVVPAAMTITAYNIFQKRILKFEETGRVCSTAGRDLHLPKFMK